MNASTSDTSDLSLDELVELERRAAERAGGGSGGPGGSGDDRGSDPGDGIVLPWWQHPLNIVTIVVATALAALMIGWMIGDNGARTPHDEVDTGFLQDMREHHEQAVLMGFIYRGLPDTDPGLRTVAAGIVRGQSIEVGRMIQLLRQFGELEANESDTSMTWMGMSAGVGSMPGMATDTELDELGMLSGAAADELFVELMTDHHEGGAAMAEYAVANASNPEVRDMAASMASAQRAEIDELASLVD